MIPTSKPEDSSSVIGQLTSLLPKKYNAGKLEKLISLYITGQIVYQSGKKQWDKWQTNNKFVISIPGDDDLYPLIHEWIIEQVPPNDRHALIARVNKSNNSETVSDVKESNDGNTKTESPTLKLLYDSTQVQTLTINGSLIEISLIRPDWAGKIDLEKSSYLSEMARREERIVFTAKSSQDLEKVIEFLKNRASYLVKEKSSQLYICNRWGGWSRRNDLPQRSLDSVVLRRGQKEDLLADFNQFLSNETMYDTLGVPWHRGYIFYGPPGTGKTSLARALASYLKLDTYYIPLRDLEEDSSLINAIADVPARSLLLLEDIDTIKSATSEDTGKGISAGGLLNALDGVITPHGLLMVMTSNHIELIDPRLIRPGRVDRHEEFEEINRDQLIDIVKQFVGIDLTDTIKNINLKHIYSADIIDIIKSNLNDTENIILKIKELIQ